MAAYATPSVFPRWPLPVQNGTAARPPATSQDPVAQPQETPSSIPSPTFVPVSVAPANELAKSTTPHAAIPSYTGPGASLLQGYCTEPGYTILDAGPTALWVPVVGCISSKSDCCATSTTGGGSGTATTGGSGSGGSGAATTTAGSGGGSGSGDGGSGNGQGGGNGDPNGAQFPISYMPSQGTLTGCPKDYHTVGGTACCPSSYWLWNGKIGGQIPCYSSLSTTLDVPPMPDTLADHITGTSTSTALATTSQKPTSAINNIAFAMQYPVIDEPKPVLKKGAKIGIGVGAAGAAVVLGLLVWLLIRKFAAHKKTRNVLQDTSVHDRFGNGVDMSRVAHEQPGTSTTHAGSMYTGVPTRYPDY